MLTNIPPIISVIIPCYKQAQYLSEALDSIISQTYANWEAIIVNDESPDNTEEVAREYIEKDIRIKYIKQPNSGPSASRNNGIKMAKGKYILPLDADDKIAPTFIEKGVLFLESNPNYTLFFTNGTHFGDRQGPVVTSFQDYGSMLRYGGIVNSSIYKKDDWERIGGYDETFRLGNEDWDFYIRLLYHSTKVYQDSEALFYYRVVFKRESTSAIANKNKERVETNIYKKHFDKYVEYFGNPLEILNSYIILKKRQDRKLSKIASFLQDMFQIITTKLRR